LEFKRGVIGGGDSVSGEIFGLEVRDDSRVPHVGEGEREQRVPVRDELAGRGLIPLLGRFGSPWPSSIFLFFSIFFFFCFLISIITFAFVTQMTSNQFVKFSKIPSNIPEQ
jgi:hypothetical protein